MLDSRSFSKPGITGGPHLPSNILYKHFWQKKYPSNIQLFDLYLRSFVFNVKSYIKGCFQLVFYALFPPVINLSFQ